MSFSSYLSEKFEYSHENQFFREFSKMLDQTFGQAEGEHILIGNLSVNGNALDALYLSDGQVTIIDFKNYEGKLKFSENNPWRMNTPTGETVFVQGGAKRRNPFHQINTYRRGLMDYLSGRQEDVLLGIRDNINWGHIGGIVLFQRNVEFDNALLPIKIKPYFQIQDINGILNALADRYSKNLELGDNELRNILQVLDIREENLLQNYVFEEKEEKTNNNADAAKLALIRRLIEGKKNDSNLSRVINYYKTLINVERFKEPTALSLHPFPLDPNRDLSNYEIDISTSQKFYQTYLTNRHEKFPKNIFIGLNIVIDGKGYPLLHTIILVSDIPSQNTITINFNSFELYNKSLESMGLGEDIIEELTTSINEASTLEEKLKRIKEYIGVSVESTTNIVLGLSNESLFSSQLLSELKNLAKNNEAKIQNNLYKNFIFNQPIQPKIDILPLNPIMRVTQLNDSQENAVKMAFKEPLTVVTGPPGTGKSQVVINILANAIFNGHSCIFASKNNKAVDNVKERMDSILHEPYLVRFGSKEEILNKAKPILSTLIARKNQGAFENKQKYLDESRANIKQSLDRIEYLQSQINMILEVKKEELKLQKQLDKTEQSKISFIENINPEYKKIFLEKKLTVNAKINDLGLMIHKIESYKKGFISKLFFSWFQKNKFIQEVKEINDNEPKGIYELLERKVPLASPDLDILDSLEANLNFILELKKFFISFVETNQNYQLKIDKLNEKLRSTSKKLIELEKHKLGFQAEIQHITEKLDQKGKDALNLATNQHLYELNTMHAQHFIDYLPSNNVWKDKDISEFERATKGFLKYFNAICLTSLSVKNSFPLREGLVDLLIIDEASQCDIASAIPLIYRAKRIVVIGDPLQLTHITSVQKYEDEYIKESLDLESFHLNYVEKSLYDYCFDLANKSSIESIFLQEHYRCHPEIINFSNSNFYERKLGQSMTVMTTDSQYRFGDKGINWVHVNGEMHPRRNVNIAEVNKCIDLAIILHSKYPEASIGIVTPFRDQYQEILRKLPSNLRTKVKVDTVHKYQGDEKDIVIFSIVATDNSSPGKAWFINRNDYLINVAITRAKSSLYIVGNHNYCKTLMDEKKKTPLSLLATYVEQLNKIQ